MGECLLTELPNSLHENALSMGEIDWPTWSALLHTIETGNTGFEHAFKMEMFDYFTQHAELGSRFDRLMGKASVGVSAPSLAYIFLQLRPSWILLAEMGRRLQPSYGPIHICAGRFRYAQIIEIALLHLQMINIADRCEAIGGDFFFSVPAERDAYIMKWVSHLLAG